MAQRFGRSHPFIVARSQARCAVNLLLAFSVLSGGCASGASTSTPNRTQMSDEDGRTAFGPLGVATIEHTPLLSSHRPGTPTSAAKAGAEIGLSPLDWPGEAAALGVVITPFTVASGAIYGALAGKSSEDTETAVSNLDTAIREGNVQQRLRNIVIARISREYGAVVPVNDTATTHEEIATVVEVGVNFVYLDGGGSRFNPKLRLSLVGNMRIHREGNVVNVTSIGSSSAGEPYTLEDWAADDAKAFEEGIARELASFADDIASKLVAWRIANEHPAGIEQFKAICSGTSVWERLGLDLLCPPAVTPVPMKR